MLKLRISLTSVQNGRLFIFIRFNITFVETALQAIYDPSKNWLSAMGSAKLSQDNE